ncbi:MAG: TonB-dependent receptor [Bacteroidia bacterium]
MKRILLLTVLIISMLAGYGQFKIEGVIVDNAQEPVPFVEGKISKHDIGFVSGEAGNFMVKVPEIGTYYINLKRLGFQSAMVMVDVKSDVYLTVTLLPSAIVTEKVLISSTRANTQTGTTFKTLTKAEIEKQNFGQDIPFLLDQTPGVVVNSDAGAGVGYTGLRIRGSDPTRINVTLNGIPYNDPESHGVFWVNLPDMASSTNSIQIQRGVGASTNGAGAFGATINLETNGLRKNAYADLNNSFGSFNTRKHSLQVGTGLLKDRWAFDFRVSKIASDGWVNRATSDLQSYFLTGGYYGKNTILKLNIFGGKETTYQSWNGTPEAVAKEDEAGINAYADRNFIFGPERDRLFDEGRQYNFYTYDNEVDNYQQDHYQLHLAQKITDKLNLTSALHYTYGRGYFEQFKDGEDFEDYPTIFDQNAITVGGEEVTSTDLIRRRWLDNDFYGLTFSLNYRPSRKANFTLGGAVNRYDGDHFGEVTWARFGPNSNIRDRYYDNRGVKDDMNVFLKGNLRFGSNLTVYGDVQFRRVDYRWGDSSLTNSGIDADQRFIQGERVNNFFNPKAGFSYQLNEKSDIYGSFAVGNREPVRSDIIDAPEGTEPEPETLYNTELGYRFRGKGLVLQANGYWMHYRNQLVPTGELNDVGATIRQNVRSSYRAGVELDARVTLAPKLFLSANAALSNNRIAEFDEIVYRYDANFDLIEVANNSFSNTVIAFSPSVVGGATLAWQPLKGSELALVNKYVGRQYLDNTTNINRSLDPFYTAQVRATYSWKPTWAKKVTIGLQINNLFNARYSPNGYTYNYEYDGSLIVENFLYPQAGTNVMGSIGIGF